MNNKTLIDRNKIDLLIELVKTSFKMRYQNSFLGFLWVLIKPYSTFLVLYYVWTRIINANIPNYSLYLLLGIIFFTYINELIILGQLALLDKAGIILKVNFPRQIAVLSALISAVINLGINMVFFTIISTVVKLKVDLKGILYFLFVVLVTFILALGISFFTSVLTVRLRDLKNIFELLFFLLFYASPILYVIGTQVAPGSTADLIAANPVGIIINQARAALGIYGERDAKLMIMYFVVSLIIFAAGWVFFSNRVKKVAEFF